MMMPPIPGKTSSHQVRRSCGLIPDQINTSATPINNVMCDFFTDLQKETKLTEIWLSWPFNFLCFLCYLVFVCQFNRQINRGDHAVGFRDSFRGDLECGAVIGTRSRKGEAERRVHAGVKLEEFERD